MKRHSDALSGSENKAPSPKRHKQSSGDELEDFEISLSKMSEKERLFFKQIFDFNTLASFTSGTACQICDVDISYSVTPIAPKGKGHKGQVQYSVSSTTPIICCVECKQVDSTLPYTICLECFRKGAEKKDDGHKNSHDYYIMD